MHVTKLEGVQKNDYSARSYGRKKARKQASWKAERRIARKLTSEARTRESEKIDSKKNECEKARNPSARIGKATTAINQASNLLERWQLRKQESKGRACCQPRKRDVKQANASMRATTKAKKQSRKLQQWVPLRKDESKQANYTDACY